LPNFQIAPGGLYTPPGGADGVYLARKSGVRFTEFYRLKDGTRTTVVLDTTNGTAEIDVTAATTGQFYLTSNDPSAGPGLCWGGPNDDEPILTEAPL
jgi:hypothetical protein